MQELQTIGQVLQFIEKHYANPRALAWHNGKWHYLSTREFIKQVKQVAWALVSLGIQRGDRVGIVALPSARWTIADLAIMSIGAVSVPLFANISEDNFQFEINQCQLKTVFVGGADQWERCQAHKHLFQNIISLDDTSPQGTIGYADLLQKGGSQPNQFQELLKSLKPDDLATIIYTSGSTGMPKGAAHTHYSICSLLNNDQFVWNWQNDSYLSFLPLAHVFARMLNLIMITWGVSIYYYNDVKNLGPVSQEVKPTVLVVVPRLLEKMYAKMSAKVNSEITLKRKIGLWAFNLANQEKPSHFQKLIAEQLVYKKLRNALGGNLRVVFSGGSALNPSLYRFFLNAGFPIFEGWGLTETCPVSVNLIGKVKIGTVGPVLPGLQVKTDENGELLVKGKMLMSGYYQNPELTNEVLDKEGWFHTGDKGSIDQEGYISILGRLKELVKTSTGEMIAPIPIEQALTRAPFIDTAVVVAENRKFVSCLIVPDFDALNLMKEKQGLKQMSDVEFLKQKNISEKMEQLLEQVNAHLNHWEKIRSYRFIPQPLSIETGELTPSMKVRREAVEKKYKDLIDTMYQEDNNE